LQCICIFHKRNDLVLLGLKCAIGRILTSARCASCRPLALCIAVVERLSKSKFSGGSRQMVPFCAFAPGSFPVSICCFFRRVNIRSDRRGSSVTRCDQPRTDHLSGSAFQERPKRPGLQSFGTDRGDLHNAELRENGCKQIEMTRCFMDPVRRRHDEDDTAASGARLGKSHSSARARNETRALAPEDALRTKYFWHGRRPAPTRTVLAHGLLEFIRGAAPNALLCPGIGLCGDQASLCRRQRVGEPSQPVAKMAPF